MPDISSLILNVFSLFKQLSGYSRGQCIRTSDCNLGIEFSIPGFGIEKFVIPRSCFGIKLTDWLSF